MLFEAIIATHDLTIAGYPSLKILSILLSASILTAPSYFSGWLSGSKGTIIGLLVPAIACTILTVIYFSISTSSFKVGAIIIIWLDRAMLPLLVGTVSGAAGQLHRTIYKDKLLITNRPN